ncbi:MAG: DUF2066 domain-containing protein [Gammaproteobacteria bacterium]|nr:DUF2066 domain-containing protein [Gammaproteobacteria bacterium]
MLHRLTLLCAFLFLGLVMPGLAGADVDLFSAESEVGDETAESRNQALASMLGEVLVRVSGNTGIASQPTARPLLEAAPSLVQSYRYRSEDRPDGLVRYLSARFDQAAVERMMRAQGLPVWSERPRVLLWIATERDQQRALLNLDEYPEAQVALRQRADYRGLPLQLPLHDLEDQAQLTAADVWAQFQPAVRQASARYPHDLVATARLSAQGERWRGNWTLISRDGVQSFDTPAQALPDALGFAVDQIQNLLAARHAPFPGAGSGDGTLLHVSGVSGLGVYARLMQALAALPPVRQVALREVAGDRFTLELAVDGDDAQLRRALDADAGLLSLPGRDTTVGLAAGGFVPALAGGFHYRVLP